MRLSSGQILLIIIWAFVGVVHLLRPTASVGVVALAAIITVPTLLIMSATRKARGPAPRRRRSDGFNAKKWAEGNRHETGGGNY